MSMIFLNTFTWELLFVSIPYNNFYKIHKVPLTLTLRQSLRWIYEEVMYGIYRAKVRTARRS
jgi:hypothetical protein